MFSPELSRNSLPALDGQSPDWRVVRANGLIRENLPLSKGSDPLEFRQWCRFLKKIQRACFADMLDLQAKHPEKYGAYKIWKDARSERWMLEASLLTIATFQQISEFLGVSEAVVKDYEYMFFEVRSKLAHRGYILGSLHLAAASRSAHKHDMDFSYKTIAYGMGWDSFKEYVDYREFSKPMRTLVSSAYVDGLLRIGLEALKRIEVNNYNAVEVIAQCSAMIDRLKATEQVGGTDKLASVMSDLLKSYSLNTMTHNVKVAEVCEPRAEEMLGAPTKLHYGDPIPITAAKEPDNGQPAK